MKTWNEVKSNIKSFDEKENKEFDLLSDIIRQIIIKRSELGLSQKELAEMSGVKKTDIVKLECLNSNIKIDVLIKILCQLNLKFELKLEEL